MTRSPVRAEFEQLVAGTEPVLELDRIALLIAAEEYPELPIDSYLVELDGLAERVSSQLHADAGPHEVLSRMRSVLVDEDGFSGNSNEYYDPRNSFLNDVLDRRRGIPIALSVVYLEIARRLGFELVGVGFPGHFFVKHHTPSDEILIDPFDRGRILAKCELQARLDQMTDGTTRLEEKMLGAVSTRELLFRMLSNLKSIYTRARDWPRALSVVERLLLLVPDRCQEHRDRGLLLSNLERPFEALVALSRYRELTSAASGHRVDPLIERLRARAAMSN